MLRQRLDNLKVVGIATVPAAHGSASQADMGAAHHPVRVEKLADTQAVALRAGAVRVIEGKHARLEFLHAVVAVGAGIARTEQLFLQGAAFIHG